VTGFWNSDKSVNARAIASDRHRDFNIGTREFHRLWARPSLPDTSSPEEERSDIDLSEAKPGFRPPATGKIKLPKKSGGARSCEANQRIEYRESKIQTVKQNSPAKREFAGLLECLR
jgi:hypothetical protein